MGNHWCRCFRKACPQLMLFLILAQHPGPDQAPAAWDSQSRTSYTPELSPKDDDPVQGISLLGLEEPPHESTELPGSDEGAAAEQHGHCTQEWRLPGQRQHLCQVLATRRWFTPGMTVGGCARGARTIPTAGRTSTPQTSKCGVLGTSRVKLKESNRARGLVPSGERGIPESGGTHRGYDAGWGECRR